MSNKKIKIVEGQSYEYELYSMTDPYSDILKQKLEPFDFTNPPVDPKYLSVSLIETMVNGRGVGLAANQCGLPYRVFVMGAEKVGFACFNPEILEAEGEEVYEEGCLSFPGLFLKINRAERIKVKYTDFNGIEKEERFSGLTARIFQHELDHLNGVCYINKVSRLHLDRAKEKVKKNLKRIEKHRKDFAKNEAVAKQEVKTKVLSTSQHQPKTFEYNTGV
jgi:peptide deformylase